LIVLARLRAPRTRSLTTRTAGALLALDAKIVRRKLNRDGHWPLRIAELYAGLVKKDPPLGKDILAHPDFGRPSHVLFVPADAAGRKRAAEVFLARAKKDPSYEWAPAQVEVLAALPEEKAFPVLRRLWDHGGLEEAILSALARKPTAPDRDKFLEGLN